jgi:hypothetical protein
VDDHLRASNAGRDRTAALPGESRLERGYRRLLALYPARYRRVHEQEMLAVLMTASADGQHRPGAVEAADLIIGALRIRCQAVRKWVPGWRGTLALVSAGAVLGLLAGIPVASVSAPLQTAIANVRLATPARPATAHDQQAIASSYPVLARAVQTIQPSMSVRALQSDLRISLQSERPMVIRVQVSNASQATRAAAAVADSYIAYVSSKSAPAAAVKVRAPTLQSVSSGAPRPGSADVLETSGLGALSGAMTAAVIRAGALIPRRRRLRIT